MKTVLSAALAFILAAPASADVTVGYVSSSSGYRGMGGFETSGQRSISGLKSRDESSTRFTGAVMKRLAGRSGERVRIVRVDLGKIWELDPAEKTCVETPIALPPEEAPRAEKPTHRIKSATAEVKATGETKDVHGFKAARHAAALVVVVEDLKTKETAQYKMLSDIWAAPWTETLRAAKAEESRFHRAYAEKLGLELSAADRQRFGMASAGAMLSAGGPELEKALAKLGRELSKIDGYPVLTETSWQSPSAPSSAKAGTREEGAGSAAAEAAGAGSVSGAATSLLGGLAKRAVEKKAEEAAAPEPGKAAITVRTEVTKVETAAVPPDRFEVPEGYSKKGSGATSR